jgi:RNA polymerase sigma factor (sigma-70 family)
MAQTQPTPEQMFLAHLPAIDGIARAAGRRRRLTPDETEEFRSIVRLRLIEDDYAVIREFRGSSSFRTFLTVVIARLCLDYRAATWGRWRTSSKARRLGDTAVALERLMIRDGLPLEQAARSVRTNDPDVTTERLQHLAAQIPSRVRRIRVGEECLETYYADTPAPDAWVTMSDGRRVTSALARALTRLDAADRRIMKLRFTDGLSVVGIARREGLEQASLYRRVERILRRLRRDIEGGGVQVSDVRTHLTGSHWSVETLEQSRDAA